MKRRELLAGFLPGAVVPHAWAQQPAMPVVGCLNFADPSPAQAALRVGLKESGYVEGRNVAFAYRGATLAAELVALKVAVIVALAPVAALAARNATRTIPIVFSVSGDPVDLGLVDSFSRPGGNATGVANFVDLTPKRLDLLRVLLPNARSVGYILDPGNPNSAKMLASAQAAAGTAGFDMQVLKAGTESEIEQAIMRLAERRAE